MSDPNDWRDHASTGGFIVGVLWAVRELLPRFLKGDDNDGQRKITPADVREEVLKMHGRLDLLVLHFSAFQAEENRVHAHLEQEIRDAMREIRNGGT